MANTHGANLAVLPGGHIAIRRVGTGACPYKRLGGILVDAEGWRLYYEEQILTGINVNVIDRSSMFNAQGALVITSDAQILANQPGPHGRMPLGTGKSEARSSKLETNPKYEWSQ